jgi:hypothetical protein
VIGVVGHRGIRPDDREILKEKLKTVFLEFRNAYPKTPLVVLSARAERADQVAARAAIEAGAFVRAPLPFSPEIYRQRTSSDTPFKRAELDALLAHPKVEWFEVPMPGDIADPETGGAMPSADRTDNSGGDVLSAVRKRNHLLQVASERSDESCQRLRHDQQWEVPLESLPKRR